MTLYQGSQRPKRESGGPCWLEVAAWTKAPRLGNVGCVCVTNRSGSTWLERTLGKLAEEHENVSQQWGSHWVFVAKWASYQNYPAEEKEKKSLAEQREAQNFNRTHRYTANRARREDCVTDENAREITRQAAQKASNKVSY